MNLTVIFKVIVNLSLMGTALVVLLLLMKALLRGRLSAFWHYTIWFLLVVRLVLPVAPENGFSIYNLFKPVLVNVQQHTGIPGHNGDNIPDIGPQLNTPKPEPNESVQQEYSEQPQEPLKLIDILAIVWFTGAVIMALVILLSNIRFYSKMRYSIPCRDPLSLEILKDCYGLASIHRPVPLFLNENIKVPMLFGVFRPRLLMSGQVLNQLSPEEKRHIFLHELIHFKRNDILSNWITAFLKCVYWFNPVILYAFHLMREDCELSCDESVLERLAPTEYRNYGQTILNLIGMYSEPNALACTSGLIAKKSSVKRRIHMISKFKQRSIMGTIAALCITLLVGCSVLTNARSDRLEDFIEPTPSPTAAPSVSPSESLNPEQPSESPMKENTADTTAQPEQKEQTVEEKVQMYLDKLKDKSFTGTYGEGFTWYTAAEELGMIGKPAIPGLIEKLDSKDDYERTLAIYALLLATQHDNVKAFTNGEYIDVTLDFNPDSHPAMIEKAKAWWEKYKSNF